VQALSRGLDILSQFTAQDRALSLAELSRRVGLHPATVYRFVKTLQNKGFLALDVETGLYRVGPSWAAALFALGGSSILTQVLEQDLRMVAETTGEGASLSIRRGDEVQIVNIIPASSGQAVLPASAVQPLTATWNPHVRVHLAYSSEDDRERVLAVPAVRYTERTVTDAEAMRALLATTAAEGIAYSCEEHLKGNAGAAVPVFSKSNLVAALGLHFHAERFDDEHLRRYAQALRAAAAAMGRRLDEEFTQAAPEE
jgi:IclR family transcriptional regulator, acetate operon repressor